VAGERVFGRTARESRANDGEIFDTGLVAVTAEAALRRAMDARPFIAREGRKQECDRRERI
jgi:hypothetical protein